MIARLLRNRFIFGPPLLSAVIRPFKGLDRLGNLYKLAQEYTPEICAGMSVTDPSAAADKFVKAFSARWFPLVFQRRSYDYNADNIGRLVTHIPAKSLALKEWAYERQWDMPPGQLLAEVLLQKPPRTNGSRLAVVDIFLNKTHEQAPVDALPATGHSLGVIKEKLKDAPWPGLLDRCRWLYSRTGNSWLDGWEHNLGWSLETVEKLSRDWPTCQQIIKRMEHFDDWLNGNFTARCAEVIRYINGEGHE